MKKKYIYKYTINTNTISRDNICKLGDCFKLKHLAASSTTLWLVGLDSWEMCANWPQYCRLSRLLQTIQIIADYPNYCRLSRLLQTIQSIADYQKYCKDKKLCKTTLWPVGASSLHPWEVTARRRIYKYKYKYKYKYMQETL